MPISEEHISDQMDAAYRTRKTSTTSLMSGAHSWPTNSIDPPHTPLSFGTTDANSGSYFKAAIQLSIIIQSILTTLYNPSTIVKSAVDIQQEMVQLNHRLDQWALSLPQEFNFQVPTSNTSMAFSRERMILGFQLCSARMLLGRACINPRRQAWREGHEATFARRMADSCIESAKILVNFLPETPNSHFIYDQGPWWCIIHHMMQAASVFLLGLSYPFSTPQNPILLIQYLNKVIRWLQVMQDNLAGRAVQIAVSTFETVSRRHNLNLWKVDPTPAFDLHPAVNPTMSVYAPTRYVPPGGATAFDYGPAGAAYPACGEMNMFADDYHVTK